MVPFSIYIYTNPQFFMINYFHLESKTDGNWSPWSDWSSCPKRCTKDGGSFIKRYRQCNMPPPMFGGKPCPGNSTEEIIGCLDVCPGILIKLKQIIVVTKLKSISTFN